MLGVTVFVLWVGKRSLGLAALGFGAAALGLIVAYYSGGIVLLVLLALIACSLIYAIWNDRLRDERIVDGPETFSRRALWATCILLPLVAGWLFLVAIQPTKELDIHHDGEVLTSAIDLLDGGIPFRTFFWPHGVSDSGVGALIIGLTGNQGMGTIAVLRATTVVVGFLTLFMFALGMLREPIASLLFATVVSLVAILISTSIRDPLLTTVRSLFPILAFYLLSLGTHRRALFCGGILIGLGYIWRIDSGVFCLATVFIYLCCDRYYRRGYACGEGSMADLLLNPRTFLGLCGDLSFLLLGVVCALAVVRLSNPRVVHNHPGGHAALSS